MTAFYGVMPTFAASGTQGSASIASASILSSGDRIFGNTATDAAIVRSGSELPMNWNDVEYWKMPLLAGDRVTVTFEATTPPGNPCYALFPANTTDATISNATSVNYVSGNNFDCGTSTNVWVISSSGSYVFVTGTTAFGGADGGFEFSVAATHKALLFAPKSVTIASVGVIPAVVRTPSGSGITSSGLHINAYASWATPSFAPPTWHLIGTGTPRNGKVSIRVVVPKRFNNETIRVRLKGSGGGYRPLPPEKLYVRDR